MRASGANATLKHLEEVSMSAMLLMDTSKKVDSMFDVCQSSSHTIRDASAEIKQIITYLQTEKVTENDLHRKGEPFNDPRILGSEKVAKGSLEAYLKGEVELESENFVDSDVDMDYELYKV